MLIVFRKPAILLDELGLTYETVYFDFSKGEQKSVPLVLFVNEEQKVVFVDNQIGFLAVAGGKANCPLSALCTLLYRNHLRSKYRTRCAPFYAQLQPTSMLVSLGKWLNFKTTNKILSKFDDFLKATTYCPRYQHSNVPALKGTKRTKEM